MYVHVCVLLQFFDLFFPHITFTVMAGIAIILYSNALW